MVEGLLLHRIEPGGHGAVIYLRIELAVMIDAHAAESPFVLGDHAVLGAEGTEDLLLLQLFVIKGFPHATPSQD